MVNAGSSSVKLAVVDPETGHRGLTALAERLKMATLVNEVEAMRNDGYVLFRKELNPYGVECCSEFAFAEKSFLRARSPVAPNRTRASARSTGAVAIPGEMKALIEQYQNSYYSAPRPTVPSVDTDPRRR